LSLLAVISAQQLCTSGNDDLSSTLVTDFAAVTRDANVNLDVSVRASVDISTEDGYKAAVTANFAASELTAQQVADIKAEASARLDAVLAAFPVASRTTILLCLTAKKILIDTVVATYTSALTVSITTNFKVFTDFQDDLKDAFDAWVSVVASADVKDIIDAQISITTQHAVQLAGDAAFYIAFVQQKQGDSYLVVSNAVYAWLNAVATNANDVAAKRQAAEDALAASITLAIDFRRANEIKAKVDAEIEAIKQRLVTAKANYEAAVARAWADIRAQIVAQFQDIATKIDQYRQRIADYLAGIRCDTTTATITLVADTNDAQAAATVQIRGIKCYDTNRPDADLKAVFCASLKAYFIAEQATANVNVYTCNVVAKKRSLEGVMATDVNADMTAADPNTNPPPPQSSSSVNVACIVILLLAMLFHF
jgi:hypothetical protein